MSRIKPVQENEVSPAVKVAFGRHIEDSQSAITNTKGTLAHSLLAFEVYMQWYPLYTQVEKILGRRMTYLYAYAISKASACSLCTAFFRKLIIEAGEDPENLQLTPSQKTVMDFGFSIAKYHGNIADHLYNELANKLSEEEMVNIIAFTGQMIAMNVFNNVAETDLDDHLAAYRPPVHYS